MADTEYRTKACSLLSAQGLEMHFVYPIAVDVRYVLGVLRKGEYISWEPT